MREMPGSGASGGLGTGLQALIGATLYPRYEIVMQYLDLDSMLQQADLVITAEGCIDFQTPRGKIPVEVAQRAKQYQLPVIVLAGSIGKDASVNYGYGIDSYASIMEGPCSLSDAIGDAANLLTNETERIMRFIVVGQKLIA